MKYTPDFSSRFRILKGGKISLVVSALIGSVTILSAAPSGGQVTSGSATISQSGATTNITQSTNKATINWQNFSIASNETVNFAQPNVNSITLNRVVGNEKSIINGALNANGQVWLLNSSGVLFGKDASINTAGILATTKTLSDADFNAGNYNFKGESSASVINMGTIEAIDSGYVALLANTVSNEGTIKAIKGTVHLTGANEATINLNGNSLVNLTVNKGVLDALVENKGAVIADGGKIFLTTNAVDELLKGVVNNSGVLEANSLDDVAGHVELFAHGGTANVSGTVEAVGGFVETSGKELSVADGTVIKAKKWLIDPENVTIESTGGNIGTASVSASVIETALESADVEIQATNDITVNEAIDIVHNNLILSAGNDININANVNVNTIPFGMNYYGLLLMAGNDINVNAIVDVRSQNVLGIFYGFDGSAYNTTSRLNMGMNGGKTAFTGKINLVSDSIFYMNEMLDGTPEYTIISDRAGLEAIDDNYAETLALVNADGFVMQDVTDALGRKYVLGGDIDLSGRNWLALGDATTSFTGTLNALGHTIDGMTIYDADLSSWDKGLFSSIYGGSVSNLALTNVDVNGLGNEYGALAGWAEDASISNIILQGSVKGDKDASDGYFGGLIGYTSNIIIDNVHANVVVEGSNYIGGLVGYGEGYLTITNSSSKGDVKFASEGAGGLVGYFYGDGLMIEKSFNTGNIGAMADTVDYSLESVGGLVGYVRGSEDGYIKESFNTGSVTGTAFVGGIVGYIDRGLPEISDTFNTGTVTAIGDEANYIGGFIGYVGRSTEITNAYNSGDVLSQAVISSENVGGFIGGIDDTTVTIDNSFSKGAVEGTTNVGGFIGTIEGGAAANISNSFTAADVTGVENVGGFIGGIDDSTVTINNVSVSGAVSGTTAVGGVIGASGSNEIDNPTLDLTNVLWNSTTSGQANAIGREFEASVFVRLYNVEEDYDYYMPANTNNANYQVWFGESYVQYDYATHYQTLVDNGDTRTGGTVQTGVFTNTSALAITTAQNAVIDSFEEPTWVINANVNGGLPYFPWHELGATGGSTPNPEPTPEPAPTPTIVAKQIAQVVNSIINTSVLTVQLPQPFAPVVTVPNATTNAMTNFTNSPLLSGLAQSLGVNVGESISLMSTTIEGTPTQTITLSELQTALSENNAQSDGGANSGSTQTRVPLGKNSLIELVDGGVNLPEGVDQEFYVVKNDSKKSKKGN